MGINIPVHILKQDDFETPLAVTHKHTENPQTQRRFPAMGPKEFLSPVFERTSAYAAAILD